jgi:hypothetical protein
LPNIRQSNTPSATDVSANLSQTKESDVDKKGKESDKRWLKVDKTSPSRAILTLAPTIKILPNNNIGVLVATMVPRNLVDGVAISPRTIWVVTNG